MKKYITFSTSPALPCSAWNAIWNEVSTAFAMTDRI